MDWSRAAVVLAAAAIVGHWDDRLVRIAVASQALATVAIRGDVTYEQWLRHWADLTRVVELAEGCRNLLMGFADKLLQVEAVTVGVAEALSTVKQTCLRHVVARGTRALYKVQLALILQHSLALNRCEYRESS
jgi:hypothetical protein